MKKTLTIVGSLVVLAIIVYFGFFNNGQPNGVAPGVKSGAATPSAGSDNISQPSASTLTTGTQPGSDTVVNPDGDEEGVTDLSEKPATEVYKTAEEALAAVKKASADYDDLVLSQFTSLGENCSWCGEFYKTITDWINSPDVTSDQKSYYSEILAVSGRVDNLQTLIDSAKAALAANNKDSADLYTEAIELATGNDDVVHFLSDQLGSTTDSTLKESFVAALSNQNSRTAAEALYNNTVANGDPDGYYSMGIGLGEFVPTEEALPYLQELAAKRDQYSHLAVKAMLNGGLSGLRSTIDLLQNSKDPAGDQKLLKDATDHVNYEDGVEDYLKQVQEKSPSQSARDFAKQVLADLSAQGNSDGTDEDLGAN